MRAAGAVAGSASRAGASAPQSPLNVRVGPHRRFAWVDERPRPLQGDQGRARRHGQRRRAHGRRGRPARAAAPPRARADGLSSRRWCRSPCAPTTSAARSATASRDVRAAAGGDRRTRCERFAAVHAAMGGLKESGQAVGAEVLTSLAGFAPPTILDQAARLQGSQRLYNLTVTNVPGPQLPLYMLGRRLRAFYPQVPLTPNTALGIAIMSYDGRPVLRGARRLRRDGGPRRVRRRHRAGDRRAGERGGRYAVLRARRARTIGVAALDAREALGGLGRADGLRRLATIVLGVVLVLAVIAGAVTLLAGRDDGGVDAAAGGGARARPRRAAPAAGRPRRPGRRPAADERPAPRRARSAATGARSRWIRCSRRSSSATWCSPIPGAARSGARARPAPRRRPLRPGPRRGRAGRDPRPQPGLGTGDRAGVAPAPARERAVGPGARALRRRVAGARRGRLAPTATVMRTIAHSRPSSSVMSTSHTHVVRPRWRRRAGRGSCRP